MQLNLGLMASSLYGNRTSIVWAIQLATMQKPCNVEFTVSARRPLEAGRNDIVRQFLQGEGDYLLFIDADVIAPSDGIMKLWEQKDNFDIVSGLYFKKGQQHAPVAYDDIKFEDGMHKWHILPSWDGKHCVPVESVGLGFCLIPRRVFKTISVPYFKMELGDDVGYNEIYQPMGEDMYFFKKVREAGMTIGCHTGVQCMHIRDDAMIHNLKYVN